MTKNESAILAILEEDARLSHAAIADMTGTDEKTVTATIEKLENQGVIVKYSAIVNDERADKEAVEALIEVRVSPTSKSGFDSIAEEIGQHEEVKSLYLMSGAYDLCVIIEGNTLKDVAMFVSEKLSGLGNVLSTATHFILKKYKISGVTTSGQDTLRQSVHA